MVRVEEISLSRIQANKANPRLIKDDKFEKLVNSILIFPKMLEIRPIVVDSAFVALGGNMRYRALSFISDLSIEEIKQRICGMREFSKKTEAEKESLFGHWASWKDSQNVFIIKADELSDEEKKAFIIKDNVAYGEYDWNILANEWDAEDLDDWGLDVWQGEEDESGADSASADTDSVSLQDGFVVPPFSVLDTRKGYWQERKKLWRTVIGDMGESRNDSLIKSPEIKYKSLYLKSRKRREELGINFREYLEKYVSEEEKEKEASKVLSAGVSLFDPVLSEIMCKWFTPAKGAKIFDCFAGDTQKGLVFASCGCEFTGIELRQEQVDINNKVIKDIGLPIRYICDDGRNVAKHLATESQDMFFSFPPYFDLEVYSDLENDASNQGSYEDFIAILREAFTSALTCLKDNRFAVVVVGDVRDKKTGNYYRFADDIKGIFAENGAGLYNEIILVETAASTALRASRSMDTRKVGKMHQNVLVFFKGNPKKIKSDFSRIEVNEEDLALFYDNKEEGEVTNG